MHVDPAQQAVEQRHQRQKTDQHDRHIHRQLAAVDGAARNGANQVLVLVLFVLRE